MDQDFSVKPSITFRTSLLNTVPSFTPIAISRLSVVVNVSSITICASVTGWFSGKKFSISGEKDTYLIPATDATNSKIEQPIKISLSSIIFSDIHASIHIPH